jgi:ubiquinone/menaquinone biosynthesis C-methylase UbiE
MENTPKNYLHGYTPDEQNRLYHQARFLEDKVFDGVDFSKQRHIIEVGCGVGAQTEILVERFPHLKISGIDASEAQILRAKAHNHDVIKSDRLDFIQTDATRLPFEDGSFDGAFITWFLEHVPDPVAILQETNRVLKHGSVIYCNEVLNSTFYIHPYSPATLQYWFAFNDHQWSLRGDPYVGAKIANYLLKAGFRDVSTQLYYWHLDNRQPKLRSGFISYWVKLLLSGAPQLLQAGKVNDDLVSKMTDELTSLQNDPDAVLFFGFMRAKGYAK